MSQPIFSEIHYQKCGFKAIIESRFKEHNDLHGKLEKTKQVQKDVELFEYEECDWTGTSMLMYVMPDQQPTIIIIILCIPINRLPGKLIQDPCSCSKIIAGGTFCLKY